ITKSTINVGTVTNVGNGNVTVVSTQPVSGLPAGVASYVFYTNAVTQDYGWTGANNDIGPMQGTMLAFTSDNPPGQNVNGLGPYFGSPGWPSYYNPDSNALLKIPSGASILINSPLTATTSPYTNGNFYLLTSGNNGTQILYNAHEDLTSTFPPGQIPAGTKVTFKVSGANLAAIKRQRGTWVLSDSLNTAG